MKVQLLCSDNIRLVVEELLKNRKIDIDESSAYCLAEKGLNVPDGKVGLIFETETLSVLMSFLDQVAGKEEESSLVITGRHKDGYEIITFDRILYFEGCGNEVYCTTHKGSYKVKEKLYELEGKMRAHGFIRVSKPFLVNIRKVGQIIPWFNGKLLLKIEDSDQEIDVTRRYVKEFKAFLGI